MNLDRPIESPCLFLRASWLEEGRRRQHRSCNGRWHDYVQLAFATGSNADPRGRMALQ